ncbi:hypothetical protein KSC_007040 [Ktedonobacter sp. SOSP1-52]|nr:hypothetical protein KSC_007040 [Ktedonobacter sp. SOSP1-52]
MLFTLHGCRLGDRPGGIYQANVAEGLGKITQQFAAVWVYLFSEQANIIGAAVAEGQLGMTQQGKASLELAVQEARSLGHHYLGTEHLLLGILREEIEDLASQVLLTASGVTLDKAREQVKQLLASE